MVDPPRRIGRPLDPDAALSRATQIAVLADPVRLRVLSAVASAPDEIADAEFVQAALSDAGDPAEALDALVAAGLLSRSRNGSYQLTADAWIRFGRLLAHNTSTRPRPPEPRAVKSTELPPIAAKIAETLAYRFASYFSPETVAKYVAESYALLSDRAKIVRFLPSLTTRFATDRLTALATAEGLVLRGTPEVLFVCVQNAGRSQMAAAILRYLAGPRVHVRTAGSAPAPAVHATVIEALDEIGVPLASEFPKPLTDEVVQAADYVITMGCGDACPIYPGRRYMDWVIDDPIGMPLEEVRLVRDDIYARVSDLLSGMQLQLERGAQEDGD
jgi:protein-tyrosine-phosphatase